jgi:hypothetical protein
MTASYDAESTRSTIQFFGGVRLDQSFDSDKARRPKVGQQKLIISVNDESFEWFEICPRLLRDITIEIFQSQIFKFFSILPRNQILRDRDGLIVSDADLRRSLRVSEPFVEVSDISIEELARLIPYPSIRRVRVTMFKSERTKRLGFSNVISADLSRLIISDIREPIALKGADIHVGDAIMSVNGLHDVFAMRRELREANKVVMEIERMAGFKVH